MLQLTWLVTGCSSGFEESFVHSILARSDRVIATARNAKSRLDHLEKACAAVLELDVTAPVLTIEKAIKEALAIYGGIDVLVNNAGYVEASTIDQIIPDRMLAGFNTNIFGPLNVTRALLPHFRGKGNGVILFMSSIGAYTMSGNAGGGTYNGSKGAMEGRSHCLKYKIASLLILDLFLGIVETLREEVAPFGITCSLVVAGHFRTKAFHQPNLKVNPSRISAYDQINKSTREMLELFDGK